VAKFSVEVQLGSSVKTTMRGLKRQSPYDDFGHLAGQRGQLIVERIETFRCYSYRL
jgi:hypothetical protein